MDKKTKKYRELLDQIIVGVQDATIEDHEEPFKSWFLKNQIILEDIEKLKKDNNDRSKISAFLLECQYFEFKVIDLLQKLSILSGTDPDIIQFKGKKQQKELYKLPLGQLYIELCKYNAKFLHNLKPTIKILNKKRIRFAHYLFTSVKGIDEIINEAKNGLEHNNKVLEELYSASVYIKQNTWYGRMYELKRKKSK